MPRLIAGGRETELREKYVRHLRVEMLPGVDETFGHIARRGKRRGDRSCFDELRTCADDAQDRKPAHRPMTCVDVTSGSRGSPTVVSNPSTTVPAWT